MDPRASLEASLAGLALTHAPNYPPNEPVFYIPRLPDISTVHEPLPPKRPPPAGYDLKTLRKQIEYLQEEITERTHNYNSLFSQNEQLWQYIQELLEANKFNASQMRERVTKLNEELRVAQKERYNLLQKLHMASDSKKMLSDLEKELQEAQVSVEEIERRKIDAEKELRNARSEREELEGVLHTHLEKLQGCEDLLELYRNKEREDAASDRADDFFFSSRTVLRSAYSRFREGVMKRSRANRISTTLRRLYCGVLKSHCLDLWKAFLTRRRFMQQSLKNRRCESKLLAIKRWKVFTVLEKLFNQAQRRKLLATHLHQWKEQVRETRFLAWADQTTADWKRMCFKRKFFRAWRGQVTFLGWNSRRLEMLEPVACKHFKRRLFDAWRVFSHREAAKGFGLAVVIAHSFKRYRFRAWHALCRRQWNWRGSLLRRFFRNVSSAVQHKSHTILQTKLASSLWITLKKRLFLRRWRLFVRRSLRRLSIAESSYAASGESRHALVLQKAQVIRRHHHRRLVQTNFLALVLRLVLSSRQRLSARIGEQHFGRTILAMWHRKAATGRSQRLAKQFVAKQYALKRLVVISRASRARRVREEGLAQLGHHCQLRFQHAALVSWAKLFVHRRRARNMGEYLGRQARREAVGSCFREWRTVWFRAVRWRQKELAIDLERAQALQRLTQLSVERYTAEAKQLEEENGKLEETLIDVQEMLADHKNDVEQKVLEIERNEKTKAELHERVAALQLQLRDLEEERGRWDALEIVLEQERAQQERERERRRGEAAARVQAMQQESHRLRLDLEAQHAAEVQLLDHQALQAQLELQEVQAQVDEADSAISAHESEVKCLEDEQEVLSRELARIQRKVQQVVSEGDSLRDENERALRRRMGELKVAEADAGVAQARVVALYDLLDEQRGDRGRMHLQEVSLSETREAEELLQKRRDFELQMGALQQLRPTSPLLTTQHLWGAAPRDDLVNQASPLSAGSEVSLLANSQAALAIKPSKPAQSDSAFKRQRYASPTRDPRQGTSQASTALLSPGIRAPIERPYPAPQSAPAHLEPSAQTLFPPSSPLTSPSVGSEHRHQDRSYASSRSASVSSPGGVVRVGGGSVPSSRPLASLSDRSDCTPTSATASASAVPAAGADDEGLVDARDAIRALTQRLKSRLNEST